MVRLDTRDERLDEILPPPVLLPEPDNEQKGFIYTVLAQRIPEKHRFAELGRLGIYRDTAVILVRGGRDVPFVGRTQ